MRRSLLPLLTLLLLPACLERVDVDELTFHCVTDSECRPGRFCDPVALVCVATVPDYPDLAEPDVVEAVEPGPEPVEVVDPEPAEPEVEVAEEVVPACIEGQPCDDGDPCTLDDRCQDGACLGSVPALDDDCDDVDDDCDGVADDDYQPQPLSCGVGVCSATGATLCLSGSVLMQCQPGDSSDEICNGQDDDCDGLTDAADPDVPACDLDADGWCAGGGPDPGAAMCPHGLGDCDDGRATAHPGASEACDVDSVDEDCDGWANEDLRETASAAWPGVTEAGWALVANRSGWRRLVDEGEAWLGTADDVDVYRAPLAFPDEVSATVVQARVGPFDAGVTRWVCVYASTPQGAPGVACQGAAVHAEAPAPDAAGCCREVQQGGVIDAALSVNLDGAQEATVFVVVTAAGGTCDTYRLEIATAM